MSTVEILEQAQDVLERQDLQDLIDRHGDAQARFLEARRVAGEASRLKRDIGEHRAMVELDAIAEMESDPDYIPGRNAEARKVQAEQFLKGHTEYQRARLEWKAADRNAFELEHKADVAEAAVSHVGLQIGARRTELEVIAAFMRGAA